MSLPYPTKVVLPFDIATAQDMNERHANDVALADGTGLDDGAVTPAKRTGGFKAGVIPNSTFGSTGNKAITGVGFKPKLVKFTVVPSSSTSNATVAFGSMDENGNQFVTASLVTAGTGYRNSSQSNCIGFITTGATWLLLASYSSMDSDGFSITVDSASSAFDVAYEAYG